MALSLKPYFPNTSIPSGSFARLNDRAQALHASLLLPKGTESGWSTIYWGTNIISIQLSRLFRNEWVVTPSISAPPPTKIVVIGCHLSLCLALLFVVVVSDAGRGGGAAGASSCTWRGGALAGALSSIWLAQMYSFVWKQGNSHTRIEKFSAIAIATKGIMKEATSHYTG